MPKISTPLSTLVADANARLSSAERSRAEGVAQRLVNEIALLIDSLPEHNRRAGSLSTLIDVDRTICHRILAAARTQAASLETLTAIPGIKGLRSFIDGMARANAKPSQIAAAAAAVDAFESLIRDTAGTHVGLIRRIQATLHFPGLSGAQAAADTLEGRQRLFSAAAEIVGHTLDARLSVHAFRLRPDDPTQIEQAQVSGLIGHAAGPGAVPLSVSFFYDNPDLPPVPEGAEFAAISGLTPTVAPADVLVREFSSDPLPVVTVKGPTGQLVQVIEPSAEPDAEPVDIVVASRHGRPVPHPSRSTPPVLVVNTLTRQPARYLIFDVYLEEPLARASIPALGTFLWSPTLSDDVRTRWFDRLPQRTRLQLLGRGLDTAPTPGYSRQEDLTRHFFNTLGWDAARFVGFRCAVEYPLWGGCYTIWFDFTPPETP